MRHQKQGRKFSRKKGQRRAFLKSLISNFVLKEKIETTAARAKELKRLTEKMITLGKKQNIASLRLLIARLSKKPALKLFYDIAPRYADRKGGYVRITKLAKRRKGDAVEMSRIEFV